jgi:putative resolvase
LFFEEKQFYSLNSFAKYCTLYQWEEKGKIKTIRTPGGKRLYDVEEFLKCDSNEQNSQIKSGFELIDKIKGRLKLSYIRISSTEKSSDLDRQKRVISVKYPDHIMIQDIGLGVNLNRTNLKGIIKLIIEGRVSELVVAYKDRLSRTDFDFINFLMKEYSDGKIIVVDENDNLEPEEEIIADTLYVMGIITDKLNIVKTYKNKTLNAINSLVNSKEHLLKSEVNSVVDDSDIETPVFDKPIKKQKKP